MLQVSESPVVYCEAAVRSPSPFTGGTCAAQAAKDDPVGIVVPTGYDVVFGPGGAIPGGYVGNNRLRVDVDIHRERHRAAGKDGKRRIVRSIVDTVRLSGGRFLRTTTDDAAGGGGGGRRPFEVMRDERLVRERVSGALREASREAAGGPKSPPAAAAAAAATAAAAKQAKKERSSTKPTADPATVARLLRTQIEIRSKMEKEANFAGDDSDDDDDDDASVGNDESREK